MAHPPSPALNREQIKNRSSRGWSGSGSSTSGATGLIPPLSFKSRQPQQQQYSQPHRLGVTSVSMSATLSSESTASSTVDGGSPFGSILAKFNDPPAENSRKSSGSFKVLEKKAVSNSPFLTGGNTTSSTGSSPQTTRKPFTPNTLGGSFSNGNTPTSSPSSAKHGLGLFTRSTPTQQSPAGNKLPARVPHKRTNSDIENRDPASESKRLAQNHVETLREDKSLSVMQAGNFADAPSPATQFNAEMEAIGGPQAIDVTYASSASGTDSSPELEQQTQPFPQPPGRRGPRPSVAALGNRGTVSSSPFLQQGLPQSSLAQASSASRKGMGPREPSNPDLRAQALADQYADDEALPRLTEATLERKASKKSVKWAEVEEVCEFDVLTEDGGSRRSSAASSTNTADDYYSNYVGSYTSDEDEEELKHYDEDVTARLQQMPGVQQHPNGDEQFYDNFRHSSAEPEETGQLRREGSGIQSQQASFVDLHPGDNSTSSSSSYLEHEDNEVQRLINEVEAASLQSRNGTAQPDDVFSTSGEFGVRTPHGSSASAVSQASSKASTPQPLRINSLSRRPLPSPPVVGNKMQPSDSSMLLRAHTEEGDFSLPDLALSASPLITFDELGLARKESLKRASPKMVYKKSASPSLLSQEVLMDSSALLRDESMEIAPVERTVSPRPQITMEEVRDSLKKRPNSLFASFAPGSKSAPLTSTPPGPSSPTKSADTPTGRASKAISARPALAPVKISSEELPTLRSATPTPLSPSREPESALDRLVREAADGNGLLHAPILKGRARSNSSGSSSSGHSFQTADSRNSDGKEALRKYNEALIAAKRKAKGLPPAELGDEGGRNSLEVPSRPTGRRRSLSTGDADLPTLPAKATLQAPRVPPKWPAQLDTDADLDFSQSLGKALNDCRGKAYRINERQRGQYEGFSPNSSRISTVGNAGDVHGGGAWKKGRRVSDMHEHHTLVKEIKDKNASKSKDTKPIIFMKVHKLVFDQRFPIPKEATYATCELDNGLMQVVTDSTRLARETNVSQEFELFTHANLEITLSFKLRKDPRLDKHLFAQPSPSSQSSSPMGGSKHGRSGSASSGFKQGLAAFFGSPKRNRISRPTSTMDINPASVAISSAPAQPILDYVSSDGNICRVSLKLGSLFGQCTAKRLKIALMCNQTSDARRRLSQIAEVEVSLFHIPQLHGIEVSSLPKNIEECLNGLELARRSEETIWESSLTQQGADCTIPRRRMVRLKGYRLIAFNEITHAVQHIFELHKAVSLEDPEEIEPATPANTAATPSTSASTPHTGRASRASGHMRTMSIEDQEEPFAIQPNSWRLTFEDDGHERYTVDFFADTPECKAKWMRYLRPIIRGQSAKPIGPPPQWALMLRDLRQQQKAQEKVAAAASD